MLRFMEAFPHESTPFKERSSSHLSLSLPIEEDDVEAVAGVSQLAMFTLRELSKGLNRNSEQRHQDSPKKHQKKTRFRQDPADLCSIMKFESHAPVFALKEQHKANDFVLWSNFNYRRDRQDRDEYFLDVLSEKFILLKNIQFYGSHLRGAIAVKNSFIDKEVFVRYSFDEWNSIQEKKAEFQVIPTRLKNGHFFFPLNAPFDTFYFEIDMEQHLNNYCEILFAVRFEADGEAYWDNNNHADYRLSFFVPYSSRSSSSPADFVDLPKPLPKSILRTSSSPNLGSESSL